MRIPVWLTIGVAVIVLGFGSYRLFLAFRKTAETDDDLKSKRGLYAMRKRTHLLIGIVYVLLGGGLLATSFGWNPFGGAIGPDTQDPKAGEAPAKPGSIPIDQLPATKK